MYFSVAYNRQKNVVAILKFNAGGNLLFAIRLSKYKCNEIYSEILRTLISTLFLSHTIIEIGILLRLLHIYALHYLLQ